MLCQGFFGLCSEFNNNAGFATCTVTGHDLLDFNFSLSFSVINDDTIIGGETKKKPKTKHFRSLIHLNCF